MVKATVCIFNAEKLRKSITLEKLAKYSNSGSNFLFSTENRFIFRLQPKILAKNVRAIIFHVFKFSCHKYVNAILSLRLSLKMQLLHNENSDFKINASIVHLNN